MIYLKTQVLDGIFSVKCYNADGVDITSQHSFKSTLYRKDAYSYTYLLETTETELSLNPDTFEGLSFLYTTVSIDGEIYKTYLKTTVSNETKTLKYTVLYNSQAPLVECSTPFLTRFSYFMPRWSTAYKNDVTNFSKITYPLFANIEKCFFKTSAIVTNSLSSHSTYKKIVKTNTQVGKIVDSNNIEKRFTYNVENSPITRVKVSEYFLKQRDLKVITAQDWKEVIMFKKNCSRLFVESPLNSEVLLNGITTEGSYVTETFVFNTLSIKQSKYNYRKLFNFQSTSKETVIRNYLDCTNQHSVEKDELLPVFIDSQKEQQFPKLSLKDNTLNVMFIKDGLFEYDSDFYVLDRELDSVYVTETQDVVGIDRQGNLCTGLLRKHLETDMPLLKNNNNNSYVYVTNSTADLVSFSIKTKEILADLNTNIVTIQVQSDKNKFYIDSNTEQFTEEPVNYILDGVNSLDFDIALKKDAKFVSVIVSTPFASYQASFRVDKIVLKEHMKATDLLFVNNDILVNNNNNILKLELIKDYYEIAADNSLILYEPNLSIYSNRGVKIDV